MKLYLLIVGLVAGLTFLAIPTQSFANDCVLPDSSADSSTQISSLPESTYTSLQYQFNSGAAWSLCWHVSDDAGLVISNIYYTAPNDAARQVLESLSIGQILFRYDEDINATHLLSSPGLGGAQHLPIGSLECADGTALTNSQEQNVCQRVRRVNHLADARRRQPIMRHELSLHAYSQVGLHIYEQVFRFSEDGEISPSVVFSGKINRFTDDPRFGIGLPNTELLAATASMLVNWRMDFNIDGTPFNDHVDEFEFSLSPTTDGERRMSQTRLHAETARHINNESFRGWRISDASRSSGSASGKTRVGYYLDPQSAGFSYVSNDFQWPNTDFSVTAKHNCEQLTSFNHQSNVNCDTSLDDYVNDESLENTDVVIWFSVAHQFSPQAHDIPAILAREISFKLIPFDWTSSTPFKAIPEENTSVFEVSQ